MASTDKDWQPRRVLIGYDGSDGAKDAVALARTLCRGIEAEFLLVNVLPFPGPPPVAGELLGYQEASEWKAFFTDAEKALAGHRVEHQVYVGGSAGQILNDIAEAEGINLVVVGSPHRGPLGRAFLGSVAEGLLHGATVAVVAAPHGYRGRVHDGFARIVVGYDGSAEADVALRRAESIAARADRELHIISVTTPPTAAPGPFAGPIPPTLPDAAAVVRRGVRSVDADIDARGAALRGAAAPELAAYCGPDDLLMVGSRSYGPLARTFLGSVSSHLIHAAPCPVLVVPRPQAELGSDPDDGSARGRPTSIPA
ncbi:MAG TPA: universal stress protein [Solirubrobacterales bacterium]|nr:universal stress protein [Solirubrobacterales bacterium]